MGAYGAALALAPTYAEARCALIYLKSFTCEWAQREEEMRFVEEDISTRARDKKECVQPFRAFGFGLAPSSMLKITETVVSDARRLITTPIAPVPAHALRSPPPLKIGYLSSDFGAHTVASLIRRVFAVHNRARFASAALSIGRSERNEWRAQIETDADLFLDLVPDDDATAAARISAWGAHIVVNAFNVLLLAVPFKSYLSPL
jgi:predicted O-linked N-acetylglucosamine transferase (SPINDLY family)